MTKRLYFTCAIKAMYMHRYHGVQFKEPENTECCNVSELIEETMMYHRDDLYLHEDCEYCVNDHKKHLDQSGKIFVAPESDHIFEPKEGDIGRHEGAFIPVAVQSYHKKTNSTQVYWPDRGFYDDNFKIIMRDNKQFFAAEVEND